MKKSSIISVLFCTAALYAAEPPKPVFYAPFDRDFSAETVRGTVQGKHCGSITMETLSLLLKKGVRGNAVSVGSTGGRTLAESSLIDYPPEFISPREGTVFFWMNPADWDFSDGKFHVMLEAGGANSWLLVYKYHESKDLCFLFGRKKGNVPREAPYVLARANSSGWKRNTWHHVAVTWDASHARIYIDGLPKGSAALDPVKKPETPFTRFTVGPNYPPGWITPLGQTLIDEVKTFDRALTAGEIENLFREYNLNLPDKSKIEVKVTSRKLLADPRQNRLNLTFSLSRTNHQGTGFPVKLTLAASDGKQVLQKTLQSNSTEYAEAIGLAALPPGEYTIRLDPQGVPGDRIQPCGILFAIPEKIPPWTKAAAGMDRTVPPPWSPVQADVTEKQLSLTARMQQYRFDGTLFPSRMESGGIPLLREPVRLVVNDQALNPPARASLLEKKEDAVKFRTMAENDSFILRNEGIFEFDGYLYLTVSLKPKGKILLRNLKLEIPLRKEVSTLFNLMHKDYYGFTPGTAGELKKQIGVDHYDQSRLPMLWIGNEERGFLYFTETLRNWRNRDRKNTVRIIPSADGATLQLNWIDYPFETDRELVYSFGFMTTPSRPPIRDGRLIRNGRNVEMWFPWETIHNVPDSRFRKKNYWETKNAMERGGKVRVFNYFAGFSFSPDAPYYPYFADEWSMTPPAAGTFADNDNEEWRYAFVCADSASFRDYYVWALEKTIRELKMNNLYFDNCWTQFCRNTLHGCSWEDEHGRQYSTANFTGNRELAKRIYKVFKKQYPDGYIARHMSQILEGPMLSFADIFVDGELFMLPVGRDESYKNIFTPGFFRASFTGHQWGAPSVFIPQFERSYILHFPEKLKAAQAGKLPDQQKNLRHFKGYFLVHDTLLWPNFGIGMDDFWKIQDRFGVTAETPFFGYCNPASPVRKTAPSDERVMVSAYVKDGNALMILMNDQDTPASVAVSYDRKVFGKNISAEDAETGLPCSEKSFQVPARDYRVIRINSGAH